jgi:HSP20 family molecular chaperone IbpA
MASVDVKKVNEHDKGELPVFEDLAKRFDEIRHRAFQLFEERGRVWGNELEDWLKAERDTVGPSLAEFTDQGEAYEIRVALPGFEAQDVQVTATPDEVVVHAESKHEQKAEDKVLWSEFTSSDVFRHISAPNSIDPDRVTATLDKGLLRITAPKVTAANPRSVAVTAA